MSLHICAGIVTGYVSKSHVVAAESLASLHICRASPEPRHSAKTSWAGSNGNLCTVYGNSECCSEPAPATTEHLCNHQCVVSMRRKCPQCVIKILNKSFASLPRKKIGSGNCFLMLFHGNMITAALRHADFLQFRQSHLKKAHVTVKLWNCVRFANQTIN